MEIKTIIQATDEWNNLTARVLDLKDFEYTRMQALLQKTYRILKSFHKDDVVPKEISKLLLSMDEFLYFSSMIEDKDVPIDFFHYQAISRLVAAIKNGFFEGSFEYHFTNKQAEKLYKIDMEQNGVVDYLQAVKNKTCRQHDGIILTSAVM